MALEEYGYEVRFKLLDGVGRREEIRVYKEIEAFERELNRRLRQKRKQSHGILLRK